MKLQPKRVGKGGGKGKKGKADEGKPEKRRQQCIPFCRGNCKKGNYCNYEHQVDGDGRPIPVRPEFLQKYDEATKRFNENKVQAKARPATRGGVGVTASMIVLEPDKEGYTSVSCVAVSVSEDYYARMDSGTNAIIVPLRVPSAEFPCSGTNCSGPRLSWRA